MCVNVLLIVNINQIQNWVSLTFECRILHIGPLYYFWTWLLVNPHCYRPRSYILVRTAVEWFNYYHTIMVRFSSFGLMLLYFIDPFTNKNFLPRVHKRLFFLTYNNTKTRTIETYLIKSFHRTKSVLY